MKNKIGSACLVAGTAIGAGMIALPMVLAQLGLIQSLALMIIVWAVMYYTALVTLEIHLRCGEGLSLGLLARKVSGRGAEFLGNASLKALSYALLAAYIYGASSVINSIALSIFHIEFESFHTATAIALGLGLLLILSVHVVDFCNRMLFAVLLGLIALLIGMMLHGVDFNRLPLTCRETSLHSWTTAVPVLFTAFGFHVVFPSITNLCNKSISDMRQAVFIGSIIPLLVYVAWTIGVLGLIYHSNPEFYSEIVSGGVEVGRLMQELSKLLGWSSFQGATLIVSLLAILTSTVGVGLGLADSLEHYVKMMSKNSLIPNRGMAVLATVAPSYLIAATIPGAFIQALSFAGVVLVFIAILIPLYLLQKSESLSSTIHYKIVANKWMQRLAIAFGLVVTTCEWVTITCL